jgi:hypothetical protein
MMRLGGQSDPAFGDSLTRGICLSRNIDHMSAAIGAEMRKISHYQSKAFV